MKLKSGFAFIFILCLVATGLVFWGLSGVKIAQMQIWLKTWGIWAPFVYILLYVIATVLILPSTALNLTGGALFGPWWGTFWTSFAAILAAIVAFAFTRTVGRDVIAKRLAGRWQAMDAEVQRGGRFYMFAVRLIPVMPYGLVNFAAGLTSVSFKDYLLGTIFGTVPGVLPFVLLGSSGIQAISKGDMWPLLLALGLTGILVGGSTWYQHRHRHVKTSSPPHPQSEINDYESR